MTFEETKELLLNWKRAQTYAQGIQRNINSLSTYKSSLGATEIYGKGLTSSPVEQIYIRIEKAQERLAKALERVFDLEDKLSEAVEGLEPSERHIIEGSFLRAQTHWQLANEMGYSSETIKLRKKEAIIKLSVKIKE